MRKTLLFSVLLVITIVTQAQVSKTLNVAAGGLASALTSEEKSTITNLTVTGTIDARDFKTIRDYMFLLTNLDLSNAKVAAYTGIEGTVGSQVNVYPANTFPASAFDYSNNSNYKSALVSVAIPSSITAIDVAAFKYCINIKSITIPLSVISIGQEAFSGCTGFTSFNIPSSVTTIGKSAFSYCTGLKSITFPLTVTSIGDQVFEGCIGFTSFNIPSTVTSIGSGAFADCTGLVSVNIPSSVTTIGDYAFAGCTGFSSFSIPSSVTSIGKSAFAQCDNLASIIIPSSVTSIGETAFVYCGKLASVIISNGVTSIGGWAFQSCTALTSVDIPSSVTLIGYNAFGSCSSLTTVKIRSSVVSIASFAFSNCSSLSSFYIYSSSLINISTSQTVFNNVNKTVCNLYVPIGLSGAYKAANQWKDFKNILEFSITGVEQVQNAEISICPNPVTDGFRVSGIIGKSTLKLLDISGKLLIEKEINNNEYVSLSSIQKGVYFVEIALNGSLVSKKIVKK